MAKLQSLIHRRMRFTTYIQPTVAPVISQYKIRPLLWRYNGRDGVSNHQPRDCLLNRLFRLRSKKTSTLRVTGLCAGNSPVTGEFPAQMASNAENVSIWWRHYAIRYTTLNSPMEKTNESLKWQRTSHSEAVGNGVYIGSVLYRTDRVTTAPHCIFNHTCLSPTRGIIANHILKFESYRRNQVIPNQYTDPPLWNNRWRINSRGSYYSDVTGISHRIKSLATPLFDHQCVQKNRFLSHSASDAECASMSLPVMLWTLLTNIDHQGFKHG